MLARHLLVTTLILGATSGVVRSDEFPGIPEGGVFGHVIGDNGNVLVGLTHLTVLTPEQIGKGDLPEVKSELVLWTGREARTLEGNDGRGRIPIGFRDIQATPGRDDTFILRGFIDVDASGHGAPAYQAYRLKNGRFRKLWSVDTARWIRRREPFIAVSPDGTMWGVVTGRTGRAAYYPDPKQLHFAFGGTRSSKVRRRETLVFEQWPHRDAEPEFLFLDSDGPVVLAPYADDYYLLRFSDFGVDSQQVEQLRPAREAYGTSMRLVHWQPGDRILWSIDGPDWAAWDLWDLGVSGFPDEPFLRFEHQSGEPHHVRGFVRKTLAGGRYRVEHLWQSPQAEHLNERHVSDWRPGRPISLAVSPNGRHGVAFEEAVRETEDGKTELHRALRRFELAPALPPPPPPVPPAGSEQEH